MWSVAALKSRLPFTLQGKQFSVIVTEGRPDETGLTMARVGGAQFKALILVRNTLLLPGSMAKARVGGAQIWAPTSVWFDPTRN